MTDERYKELMENVGMPSSKSLLMALQQVANEVAQETRKATAVKCAEIADSVKYNTSESPSDYENACLDIYDKICEEFNLPTADCKPVRVE